MEARPDRFVRRLVCQDRLGDSNSAFHDKIKRGLIPRPIKRGLRASALLESEVQAIVDARTRGVTDEELRGLVADLEARRALAGLPRAEPVSAEYQSQTALVPRPTHAATHIAADRDAL